MRFTITFLEPETKMMRTVDESGVDAKSLIDLFAEKYPNSTILKVTPHPIWGSSSQPLTKETV